MKALAGGFAAAVIAMTAVSAQTQLVSEDIVVKSPTRGSRFSCATSARRT